MKCSPQKTRSARFLAQLVFCMLTVLGSTTLYAEENTQPSPTSDGDRVPQIRAAAKGGDGHCSPSDADSDPDVFKRPCFVHALSRSRETFAAYVGLTGCGKEIAMPVPSQHIPTQAIDRFRSLLTTVLKPEYLPSDWQDVPFLAFTPCPLKTVSEVVNDVPTFVRQERDCTAEVVEFTDGDRLQAQWTIDEIEILPCTWHSTATPRGAFIRLRLHGQERLALRSRANNTRSSPGDPEWHKWEFFDKQALHDFFTNVFRVPFLTPDDFLIAGHDAVYEGVRVFHGKITSRAWETARRKANASRTPPHWWDQIRLLVTDTDPQYFCITVSSKAGGDAP